MAVDWVAARLMGFDLSKLKQYAMLHELANPFVMMVRFRR